MQTRSFQGVVCAGNARLGQLAAQGLTAPQGLTAAQGFFAAHGFAAAHGLVAPQGLTAAQGFFTAQGLHGLAAFGAQAASAGATVDEIDMPARPMAASNFFNNIRVALQKKSARAEMASRFIAFDPGVPSVFGFPENGR